MRFATIFAFFVLPIAADDTPGPFASFDLASEAILADPHDLAVGPDERLYVADKLGARIAVLDIETLELIEMLGEGSLPAVRDVSFGPGGQVALAVSGASAVAVYETVQSLASPPDIGVSMPGTEGALFHSNGDIYAMASAIGALVRLSDLKVVAGVDGHLGAHDVAEAPDGTIWVADNRARKLIRYSEDLEMIQVLDGPKFGFRGPRYLDVTASGLLAVADQDAHRVLLIDPAGADGGSLIGVIGDGSPGMGPGKFDDPEGIAVYGNYYFVSDSDNNRVVRYSVVLN